MLKLHQVTLGYSLAGHPVKKIIHLQYDIKLFNRIYRIHRNKVQYTHTRDSVLFVNCGNSWRNIFAEFQTGTYNLRHQLDALPIELTKI